MRLPAKLISPILALFSAVLAWGKAPPGSIEFFESRIRPVLIQNCYECHSSTGTSEANLVLDFRGGLLAGGDSGPAIVPGKPDESLLYQAIEHRADDLKMPPSGLQLSREVLADFRVWIEADAVDPRDNPPVNDQDAASKDWHLVLEARRKWWSFLPIEKVSLPLPDSSLRPIDQFVQQQLTVRGIPQNDRASDETLVRRIFFNLIGLPPSREDMVKWSSVLASAGQQNLTNAVSTSVSKGTGENWEIAWERLVATLLDDPRFGEHWGRHWMDWIRYAESHGSEGDPALVNAWLYRDYLIRAFNGSLPMDQMIREHIAGDLLPPRIDPATNLNQSLIATAHWRMVFHGFSPVDALEERVRFTDDQINTFSKAFLGITLSCARCHDHKFDPVSQADYYAMFGVLSSCRPGRSPAESLQVLCRQHDELRNIQSELRLVLVAQWAASLDKLPQRLNSAIGAIANSPIEELTPAQRELRALWDDRESQSASKTVQTHRELVEDATAIHWDMTDHQDVERWNLVGTALQHPMALGAPLISNSGEQALSAVHSGGVTSRILSDRESARISSPDFLCPPDSVLWVLCEGDGGATLRYSVENYPRDGTIYPVVRLRPGLQWIQNDLSYWNGDSLHVELSSAADAPLLTSSQPRSWFRVQQVWVLPKGQKPPGSESLYHRLVESAALTEKADRETWSQQLVHATQSAIDHWSGSGLSADEAELLDVLIRNNLLQNDRDNDICRQIVEQYRRLESQMVTATRVPCLEETVGQDFPLLVRGDHRQPAERVPRRFLEAIDDRPYETTSSGRLELADRVLDIRNPLTRRVLVNRVWQMLLGTGIVSTSDNFGRLGSEPTHPELLDWLADRLLQLDWSLKELIREIVTTDTWLRSSTVHPEALAKDPDNQFLGRATIRRYPAEAVRDSLLSVAGTLDSTMYGPPQSVDGSRRSIYLPVMRNALVPLLRTFDFPEPFTTVGKRDQTNVPAQSLALMNDPLVASLALTWARSALENESDSSRRAQLMLESALARSANVEELELSLRFIQDTRERLADLAYQLSSLTRQLETLQNEIVALERPIRESSREGSPAGPGPGSVRSAEASAQTPSAELSGKSGRPDLPQPLVEWDFSSYEQAEFDDSLRLVGSAAIADGALVVKNGGYAVSTPQSKTLSSKTLCAWVQLDNLDQRGGGVITVQTLSGDVFDSIVFGEQTAGHWLAGSNIFSRTQNLRGQAETDADQAPVHLAIVYQADGKILAYRNGQLYGTPYQTSGLQEYSNGNWLVSLGLRHLPADPGKALSGKILRASVYDSALEPEQISGLAENHDRLTLEALMAAMDRKTQEKWLSLDSSRKELVKKLSELESQVNFELDNNAQSLPVKNLDESTVELLTWTNFARAIFTLKEFIYVP